MSQTIKIEKNILESNIIRAERNRKRFKENKLLALNLMGAPGAGKTALLEVTIKHFAGKLSIGVIEGDIATDYDAKRIEAAGAAWVKQINTGGTCHLNAAMIEAAFANAPENLNILIIENVGNLVCPAVFDLGEHKKITVASVTEGLDKPKKYPGMYRESDALIINKIDLNLDVDPDSFAKEALIVNPDLKIFKTSTITKDGIDDWGGYIDDCSQALHGNR